MGSGNGMGGAWAEHGKGGVFRSATSPDQPRILKTRTKGGLRGDKKLEIGEM